MPSHPVFWNDTLDNIAGNASDSFLGHLRIQSVNTNLGAVLGTGWGESIVPKVSIPLEVLAPIFKTLEPIKGHARRIGIATIARKRVIIASGRIHMYEQNPEALYVFMKLLWNLGARKLILTSASGGMRRSTYKGDIVVIDGLIKNGMSPLKGARFVDHGSMLDPAIARKIWATCPVPTTHIGSYIYNPGPEFESADDRAFIDRPGITCVGMSTLPEASLWAYFTQTSGYRPLIDASVIPISCISNGLSDPHGHESNSAVLHSNSGKLGKMLSHVVKTISQKTR